MRSLYLKIVAWGGLSLLLIGALVWAPGQQAAKLAQATCHTLTTNVSPGGGGTVTRNTPPNCSGALNLDRAANAPAREPGALTPNVSPVSGPRRSAATEAAFNSLIARAAAGGPVRVIVGLDVPFRPEGALGDTRASQSQRSDIARAQNGLLGRLSAFNVRAVKKFPFIPYMALETDEAGLRHLEASSDVMSIEEDVPVPPSLAESVALVGGNAAWAKGYSGAGQAVAILDTGVDKNHAFLSGKVVSEACYSTTGSSSVSVCPGGAASSTSPGSGVNCSAAISGCDHGTHVAGIAAGKGTGFSGVAKDANIIAIQVFSRFNSQSDCGAAPAPCARTFTSDYISGLQRVQELSGSFSIAAANMSLGGQRFFSNCDSSQASTKAAIDSLRSVGIATVIASGNNGFTDSINMPACISTAVSVGSVDDGSFGTTADQVSSFSNSSSLVKLLAPGRWINSSVPGGSFANFQGTSMATPHVAGAWAVLKSKVPSATVDQVLSALSSTGVPVTDSRNNLTRPRIKIDAALDELGGGDDEYSPGTVVTLTPSPNPGYSFQSWSGCDSVSGNNCTVTMNASRTVTASFTLTQTRVLTVASSNPNSGVGITVSPNDNNGAGNGTTEFDRTYNDGTVVNLTAPSTAGGNSFQKWQRNGVDWSFTPSTSVTANADYTMTAVYVTPPSGPWQSLDGWLDMLAVASNSDGRLEAFVRGMDGVLYRRAQLSPTSNTWGAWSSLEGQIDRLAVARNQDGRLEVFVRGNDGLLYRRAQAAPNSSNWGAWASLEGGGDLLVVVSNADGRLEVFTRGIDGALWHRAQVAPNSNTWGAWASLGGGLDELAVGVNADGRLEVFVRGQDKALYRRAQVSAGSAAWGNWSSLGGGIEKLQVGRNADGRLEVFTRGVDGALWRRAQLAPNSNTWGGWSSLGGWLDRLAVARTSDGRLDVFVRGIDGIFYHRWQTSANSGTWSGWLSLNGGGDNLSVGQNANGSLEVFVSGTDHALYHRLANYTPDP